MRLDSQGGIGNNGSCSSLASSNNSGGGGGNNLVGDDCQVAPPQPQQQQPGGGNNNYRLQRNPSGGIALQRLISLPHSYSTNDASLGEYKYTVNVGGHSVKITGDCFELVRVAKLVLDDYFSGQEFLGAADATLPMTPVTPVAESKLNPFAMPVVPQLALQKSAAGGGGGGASDSGIGLNMLAGGGAGGNVLHSNSGSVEADDDVIVGDCGE